MLLSAPSSFPRRYSANRSVAIRSPSRIAIVSEGAAIQASLVNPHQPLGRQRGLLLIFYFHHHTPRHFVPAFHFTHRVRSDPRAYPASRPHRRRKAQPVESVI